MNYLVDDMAVNIGQAALKTVVVKRESFVIQPEYMQNGGVDIVYRGDIFDRSVAEFIGGPIAERSFDPRTRQPACEP